MSWPNASFEEIFEFIRNGLSVKQSADAGGLPITRIETISDGTINLHRVGYAGVGETEGQKWLLQSGDILLSHINSVEHIGKCAIYVGDEGPLVHGMNLLCLRPKADILFPRYAMWALKNPSFKASILKYVNKAVNQASISVGNLKTIEIPIPPLEEQKRIAGILDQADALRRLRARALEKLNTLGQAVFQEMFGDPATNPKGLPNHRIGSAVAKISDGPFGSNLKSEHYTSTGVRVWRLQNITTNGINDVDQAFISEEHYQTISKHTCLPGDVIIATLGDPNLRACIQPTHVDVAINKADCVQIRPNNGIAIAEYWTGILNHPGMITLAHSEIQGQTRARISMGRLREISVPIPSISQQHIYRERVASIDESIQKAASAVDQSTKLFASLQSAAFQGKL